MESVKKLFFFVALLILFCTLFSTKIIGLGARVFCKFKYDCELAYRSCDWEEGQLVFSDLVIFDPSFHAHMDSLKFSFDWTAFPKKFNAHIDIHDPHLRIKKERPFPTSDSKWFDVSVTVDKGVFDWDGRAEFSLEHDASKSRISFDWGDSSAHICLQDGKWEAILNQFKLTLLKKWVGFGQFADGVVTGRFAFDGEGNPIAANLKIANVAFALPLASIDRLDGNLSYNIDLGAKWEFNGFGKAKDQEFPLQCTGRGFFKSHWLESKIQFNEALCTIAGNDDWIIECQSITAPIASWFQAAVNLFYPEFSSWKIESGVASGKAILKKAGWEAQFEADHLSVKKGEYLFSCLRADGALTEEGGIFVINDPKYDLKFSGKWRDWEAEAFFANTHVAMRGGWDGEKIPIEIQKGTFADLEFHGKGWVDQNFDASFAINGHWNILERKIPFYCPILTKEGSNWAFDFRCQRKTWDFFRLSGKYEEGKITYNPSSHVLGQPIYFTQCPLDEIDLSLELPWRAIASAKPVLKEWGIDLKHLPQIEKTDLHFQLKSGQIALSAKGASPAFNFQAVQKEKDWEIDLKSDLLLSASLKQDGYVKGQGKWQKAFEGEFEGKIDPAFHLAVSLSNAKIDLQAIEGMEMEGEAFGGGHFIYNGAVDADFDFNVSSLKVHSFPLENEGQIHLSYTTKDGVSLSGLHLHGEFDCVVDLLQYDSRSHWIFHNAKIHLPTTLLTHKLFQKLDKRRDLNVTADLDFTSDFSTFVCKMKEGSIPYDGTDQHIENLQLSWKNGKCKADLRYLDYRFQVNLQIDDSLLQGRISVGDDEMPLTFDWEYSDALFIRSIEGTFSGIDASFHAEKPNVLVGSAHLNFTAVAPLLPPDVAQVFDEIKMGKGYEFKGRLSIDNNLPYFEGILSGKAIELFGFQFRTLLAQVDLAPNQMRIFDVKISDSAGIMKIDEVILQDQTPWTIHIPNLTILDMRPSLLLRPGGTVGPINPLVVRHLKIEDFKGILDDGRTYTGKGNLHFINSYKREETVFDLPANVLSRIVGLDLELLIPVTGDLTFEIQDGFFNLLELTNAYSEGKRSQFFLETEPQPRMDLDGNLEIFIKMKQFVLFKITESFLISIDGALSDPQFKLKKKRLFGLI